MAGSKQYLGKIQGMVAILARPLTSTMRSAAHGYGLIFFGYGSALFGFRVLQKDSRSHARLGELSTFHGTVETPIFMAVGTQGTVKGVTPAQLREAGVGMVLGNTYHLMLRPSSERVAALGGLHKMMAWDGPILTDSGGFQVFSLAELRKTTSKGVRFKSHIDGSDQWLDPERSMQVQAELGSDIAMAFDDCTPHPATERETAESMALTHAWADRSLAAFKGERQVLFGIVQGGMYAHLRRQSAAFMSERPFAGLAIGGLSVGEPKPDMYRVLKFTAPLLPQEKPRYLMGVGTPADLVNGVSAGIDMFDCVMPTRNARNGQVFTDTGTLSIKNAVHRDDPSPLDPNCQCYACTHFSRAYLHHLFKAREMLASTLMTIHNLAYYQQLMARVRQAIAAGELESLRTRITKAYGELDIHQIPEAE